LKFRSLRDIYDVAELNLTWQGYGMV